MKKFVLILVSTVLMFSCSNNKEEGKITTDIVTNPETATDGNNNAKTPVIKFNHTDYNFGVVIAGEKVTHTYKFKNIGTKDLLVAQVSPSWGCTVPDFSKKPIAPGGEGKIEVIFDSSNREGIENKKITVMTNAQPSTTVLTFSVEVVKPK